MKDRDFKLGDLDVKISDLGLDCYWTDFETKEIKHMWMNELALKELCKRFNMTDNQYNRYLIKLGRLRKLRKISDRTSNKQYIK